MVVGSYLGSLIPLIWGDSMFSVTSVIFGGIGAFIGIYIGYKIDTDYF